MRPSIVPASLPFNSSHAKKPIWALADSILMEFRPFDKGPSALIQVENVRAKHKMKVILIISVFECKYMNSNINIQMREIPAQLSFHPCQRLRPFIAELSLPLPKHHEGRIG